MKVLQESIIKVIAGPEKHSRVIPERERRLTAYHEAGHAVVMQALPDLDPVHQITIVPRGEAGGMTIYCRTRTGRTSPAAICWTASPGCWAAGRRSSWCWGISPPGPPTTSAVPRSWPGRWWAPGMSGGWATWPFDAGHDEVFIGKSMAQTRPYSEKTAAEMDGEIRRIMDDAYACRTAILEQYRPQLVEVAEYLLANETMTAEEFEKVFRTE